MYIKTELDGLGRRVSKFKSFTKKAVKMGSAALVPKSPSLIRRKVLPVLKAPLKISAVKKRAPLIRRFTPSIKKVTKSVLVPTSLFTVAKEPLPVSSPSNVLPSMVSTAPTPYTAPSVAIPAASTSASSPSLVSPQVTTFTASPATASTNNYQEPSRRDISEPEMLDSGSDEESEIEPERATTAGNSNIMKIIGVAGLVFLLSRMAR